LPGLITHFICAKSVLSVLPKDTRDLLQPQRQLYNIGSQGPDIFFYYFPGHLKRGVRGIGQKMHNVRVGKYLETLAIGIANIKNEEEKAAAFSYTAGYLTHFALDCAAHPYVYYKTGFTRPGERGRGRNRLKYAAYHRSFETSIDVMMLKIAAGKHPADEKLWQLLYVDRVNRDMAIKASHFLGDCISRVYKSEVSGKNVFSAMKHMWRLTRILQSKNGNRKRIMEFCEDIIIGNRVCSSMIHMQEAESDGLDYLNQSKKIWKLPWDETAEQSTSFTEMFDTACDEARFLIMALYDFVYGEGEIKSFLKLAGNRSLKSGIDSREKIVFQHHDIIYH